jgi:cysteinyl-tRNA synthetase
MALQLYNTLSRQREVFQPRSGGRAVKMYCCGVTVYGYCHLGHARSYIAWDTVRRYLEWSGYDVQYVQNFTDIDDKILKRAREENSTMEAVSEKYIAAYFEDMDRLNIRRADEYPRATHTIDGIKRLIHELETKGMAYASEGDVYFAVRQYPGYGKLSKRNLDDMESGASGRVNEADTRKQDPADFALWKAAKPGEPFWESDWGNGRPGWHIECSAMVRDRMGDSIDIHVGGGDLIFPHHENEIAQSEAATGQPLSTYWMHNGMVNVDGMKMGKSLNNFKTIRDLLDEGGMAPMAMRLFVLGANYRKPIDFTGDSITAATNGWQTLQESMMFGQSYSPVLGWTEVDQIWERDRLDQTALNDFNKSMDDDFNTSGALAVLFNLAKKIQRARNLLVHTGTTDTDTFILEVEWRTLVALSQVLGLETFRTVSHAEEGESFTATIRESFSDGAIDALVEQRTAAKVAKNFAEADRIRDELKAQGITLIDQPGGKVIWHR